MVVITINLSSRCDLRCTKFTLCRLKLFGLASATDATRKTAEGDNLFVFQDVAKVGVSLGQFQAY